MPETISLVAVVQPGLEKLVSRQIRALGGGLGHTEGRAGRITFDGPEDAVMRTNLELRYAERILLPMVADVIPSFRTMRRLVAEQPWEHYLPTGMEIRFSTSVHRCKLFHTGAVEDAITEGLQNRGLKLPKGDGRSWMTIDARGTGDHWTLSLDTSGAGLSRRGYRKATAKAPLRETLAAAVLGLAGWNPSIPLIDPVCGAGTLAIEAAAQAMGRAPGLDRSFAFEAWPTLDSERWTELQEKAHARIDPTGGGASIEAADEAGGAIKAARDNSSRAGTKKAFSIVRRDILETPPKDGEGLIVMNPPYGKRTNPADLEDWARALRKARPGWDLVVVGPKEIGERLGCKQKPLAKFLVGGIKAGVWKRPAAG
ncbi:MAG: hypothetical protein GY898_12710 [Proteobacteria bacterium]|nr:hypothetical protein [Pseudomonadota bacterium]